MKYTATVAVLALTGANALSVSRSDIRSLGSKTITTSGSRKVGASMKMEGTFLVCVFTLGELEYLLSCTDQVEHEDLGGHSLFIWSMASPSLSNKTFNRFWPVQGKRNRFRGYLGQQ